MTVDYIEKANKIVEVIPRVLVNRGLSPLISRYLVAERDGRAWLLAVLDKDRLTKIEHYTSGDMLHQLSTAVGGLPVLLSNSTGLRYAILLSDHPRLPHELSYQGWQKGIAQIGESKTGQVSVRWEDFGNSVVAGMTRSGKSNFLRLISLQAFQEGFRLVVIDPDGSTYPDLAGHSQVIDYANSPDSAGLAVDLAMEEYYKRVRLFTEAKEKGEGSPVLPRVLVVIDEYNSLVLANGGSKAKMAQDVIRLAYGGLKFGIHLILAGHEFTRDLVGPVAGQMVTRLCFSVRSPSISRLVVGRSGAESIRVKGRALTDPWGWVQVYRLDFSEFESMISATRGDGLSERDSALIRAVKESGGRVTYELLFSQGLTRTQADKVRADLVARGLARYAPEENNSIILADWLSS